MQFRKRFLCLFVPGIFCFPEMQKSYLIPGNFAAVLREAHPEYPRERQPALRIHIANAALSLVWFVPLFYKLMELFWKVRVR